MSGLPAHLPTDITGRGYSTEPLGVRRKPVFDEKGRFVEYEVEVVNVPPIGTHSLADLWAAMLEPIPSSGQQSLVDRLSTRNVETI